MTRLLLVLLLSILLVGTTIGQLCNTKSWSCDGGDIQSIRFQDGNDGTITQSDDFCTLIQDGDYKVDNNHGTLKFDFSGFFDTLFDCQIINEDDKHCTEKCYDNDVEFTFTAGVCELHGPNGEVCVPATSTADCTSRSCPDGEVLVEDPDHPSTSNGCGPASIPFSAPSFSFEDCCNNHDLCYGSCYTVSKKDCDDNFYTCMYCSCYAEYNDLTVDFCLELACSYYQLVDEFGCDAFQASQDNTCLCQNSNTKEMHRETDYVEVPSKWGPAPEAFLSKRLICDAPFTPKDSECPAVQSSTSTSNNNSPNPITSNVSSKVSSGNNSSDGNVLAVSFMLLSLTVCFVF